MMINSALESEIEMTDLTPRALKYFESIKGDIANAGHAYIFRTNWRSREDAEALEAAGLITVELEEDHMGRVQGWATLNQEGA